jgi:hypothetical protein
MSLDEMLAHLDAWDRTADRRTAERRIAALARREIERRTAADRRAQLAAEELRRRASDAPIVEAAPPIVEDEPPIVDDEGKESAGARSDASPASGRGVGSASALRYPSRHAH